MEISTDSVAAVIARSLKARGVDRVFALCSGHIMSIWMRLDAEGIRIIDVRDERAAVHMAQAHAEVTGELGVALVTAGPGMTNAITGIANAHVSRAPILVMSGTSTRPQENRGGLQDLDHTHLVRTITRYARAVRELALALAWQTAPHCSMSSFRATPSPRTARWGWRGFPICSRCRHGTMRNAPGVLVPKHRHTGRKCVTKRFTVERPST